MRFLSRFSQRTFSFCHLCDGALLAFLGLAVLWKGGKSLEMTWLLLGISVVLILVQHFSKETNQRSVHIPLWLWLSVMAFFGFTLLSFVQSTTQNYGLDELLRTSSFVLIFLWLYRRTAEEKDRATFTANLTRVIAFVTLASCAIGLFVYVLQPVNRFVGSFFDARFHTDYWPNAWGQYLLLSWPVVLYWTLREYKFDSKKMRSRIELLVRSAVMGCVFSCLFLSYSRGAILAFMLQLLIWGGVVLKKTKRDFPLKIVIPIAVIVSIVSFGGFSLVNDARGALYPVQEIVEKITFSADEGQTSVNERLEFWKQGMDLAFQRPVLGWGPYSFRFVQPALQEYVLATSDHAHNVIIKVAAERGIPSAVILVLIFGAILYNSLRSLLDQENAFGSTAFSMRMLTLVSVTGVLAHNMIDFNLQFVGIALPFWMLLLLTMQYSFDDSESRKMPVLPAKLVEVLLAVCILCFAFYEGIFLVVSSMGRHAEARGANLEALVWYDRAEGEIFSRDMHLSSAKILFEESKFEEAQDALNRYFVRNTSDARAWKRQGDVSLFLGDKQEALKSYREAYSRGKYNDLSILFGLIEGLLAEGNTKEIEERREEFNRILTMFAKAIEKNTHYVALSPNVEEFIAISNTLARLYPEDAPKYQVQAARVDHNAQIERERIQSRPPGYLW